MRRGAPTVKFLPDDWHSIVYNVGRLSAQLRDDIYFVGMHLADATAPITGILNMPPDRRASADFAGASRLLDETAPLQHRRRHPSPPQIR